ILLLRQGSQALDQQERACRHPCGYWNTSTTSCYGNSCCVNAGSWYATTISPTIEYGSIHFQLGTAPNDLVTTIRRRTKTTSQSCHDRTVTFYRNKTTAFPVAVGTWQQVAT